MTDIPATTPCAICGQPVEPGTGGQAVGPFPALHTACMRRKMADGGELVIVPPSLTWRCHVCGDERPDAAIGVFKRDLSERFNQPLGHVQMNARYCMDREDCARQIYQVSADMFEAIRPIGAPTT